MVLIQDSCGMLRLHHTYSTVALSIEDAEISLRITGWMGLCDAHYTYSNRFAFERDEDLAELRQVILEELADVKDTIIDQAWFANLVAHLERLVVK